MVYVLFVFVAVLELTIGQLWPMSAYPMQQFPSYDSDVVYPPQNQYYDQSSFGGAPYQSQFSSYRRGYDYQSPPVSFGGGPPVGSRAHEVAMSSLMNYVYDKDNFQPQGCGWDPGRNRCTDILNQCKGMCRDFANDVVIHDCRCVPFGYAALLGWGRKR